MNSCPSSTARVVRTSPTLKARDAEGNDIQTGGKYADVVRRQPDATWLFVIDNPNGTD